jgi:hypothetical protein
MQSTYVEFYNVKFQASLFHSFQYTYIRFILHITNIAHVYIYTYILGIDLRKTADLADIYIYIYNRFVKILSFCTG